MYKRSVMPINDDRIWKQRTVNEVLSVFNGSFCLPSNSGYVISPWLLTPIKPSRKEEKVDI